MISALASIASSCIPDDAVVLAGLLRKVQWPVAVGIVFVVS